MLIVRDKQLFALGVEGRRRLAAALVGRAHAYFPEACAALGEDGTAALVSACVERAASHGFATERSIARWVNLALMFGPRFDEEQPWAAAVLRGEGDPEAKATRLLWGGIRNERLARGPGGGPR